MRFLAMLLVIVAALLIVHDVVRYPLTADLKWYLWAAEQLARGDSPYATLPGTGLNYLYAPWFAAAFIPATWLPAPVLAVLWEGILVACAGICLWPLIRQRRLESSLAAVLIGTFLFHGVWVGQVQPLFVALLVVALPTRWGPSAIGVAASLKIMPIALCVFYAGRGEWRKFFVAVAVAAVLWAPALLFDRSTYVVEVGLTHSLYGHAPIVWGAVAAIGLVLAWRLASTRYGWLAAASFWMALLPIMIIYDPSGLAVGALDGRKESH